MGAKRAGPDAGFGMDAGEGVQRGAAGRAEEWIVGEEGEVGMGLERCVERGERNR